jgi:hypothetical protein
VGSRWSESLAVGRCAFVGEVKRELGGRAQYQRTSEDDGASVLRDGDGEYRTISGLKWAD